MDKLLIAILGFSFIFSGAGLTSAILLAILFSGAASLSHITLFSLTSLLTYYFYGFFGLFYVLMASLSLIACGAMYWFELSVDDMKQKAKELSLQEQSDPSTGPSELDKKLATFNEYKNTGLSSFCQRAGLTPERITLIKGYYASTSTRFDKICAVTYGYLCQFRETTKDIAGLKTIYHAYDQVWVYKKNIETIRSLHKMTRNMQSAMSGSMGQMGPSAGGSKTKTSGATSTADNSHDMINLDADQTGNPMESMEAMDKMFANMKPEDMESMMQMMFGGDLSKLMGGMGGPGGAPIKPTKKKVNKK